MLIHFNPSQPDIFGFICPSTMAAAVVQLSSETIHPITQKNFGKITSAHIKTIHATMERFAERKLKFKITTTSQVNLPEWLILATETSSLLIMHTASPTFISPIRENMTVINPIIDSPAITGTDLTNWIIAAQTALNKAKPELISLAQLAPV